MKGWIRIGISLRPKDSVRVCCPECGISNETTAIINNNGNTVNVVCFRCDLNETYYTGISTLEERKQLKELNELAKTEVLTTIPETSAEFSKEGLLHLLEHGISISLAVKYGIRFDNKRKRIYLPTFKNGKTVFWQGKKTLDGQVPKYLAPKVPREGIYWDSEQLADGQSMVTDYINDNTLVLVEDVMSGTKVGQALPTRSIMGTMIPNMQIEDKFSVLIGWFDNDAAGKKAFKQLKEKFGAIRDVRRLRTEKDPKCYPVSEIRQILKNACQ